jgi:hypothetical protein
MFKKIVAKILRIFFTIVGSIILLNIILFLLFSIPFVQKRAADFALGKLQPILGTELGLRGIRIKLFNSVELQGLYVGDQRQDTLLYIDKLSVQFSARDLLSNNVSAHRVRLENLTANVYRDSLDAPFNFQFIIDVFVKEKDTTVVKTPSPWHIVVNDLVLRNGILRYNILSEPETPGQFNVNHFDVHNFNFRAKADFRNPQDMNFDIILLSLLEKKSGIKLNDFNGRIVGAGSVLSSNAFNINVNNSFFSLSNARFDTDSKDFSLSAEGEADPQDIHIFVPQFDHFEHPISLNLDVHGQLPEIQLTTLNFVYGDDTNIHLSASIDDVLAFDSSNLSIDISSFSISQEDLQTFIRIGVEDFELPDPLLALGDLHLQLSAQGRLNNFQYDGAIQMEQGNATLSGIGRIENNFERLTFEGPVNARNIRIANIIGEQAGIDNANMHANMKALIQKDQPIEISANGSINSIHYHEFLYENLHFTGNLTAAETETSIKANFNTESELNKLDINAEIAFGNKMKFVVNGIIDKLDLRPFITIENWQEPSLATHINVDMAGENFDDMVGTIILDNTSLRDNNFIYNPGPIYVQAFANTGSGKKMQIMTSFIEGTIEGDYYFTTIGNELMYVLRPHLPSLIQESSTHRQSDAKNNFQFNILLKNTEDISHALGLPFYNVEFATLSGNVNLIDNETITINSYIPRLMFGSNDIRETRLTLNSEPQTSINLSANSYLLLERGHINARLNTNASNDSINNRISFDLNNNTATSNGELLIGVGFLRTFQDELISSIHIHPTSILFNGKNVDFNEATIVHRKNRIEIDNFGLRGDNILLLGIEGVASDKASDSVRIFFQNTELQNILAAFNIFNFTGAVNGAVYVSQALDNPIIRTDNLRIDNITSYNDTIGTLTFDANWNSANLGLDLDAFLVNNGKRNLEIKGFVPTGDKSPYRMGVNLKITDFELFRVLPFTTDIFSELSGSLNSNIDLTGTFAEPIAEGWIGVNEGVLKVAYTNVTYFVSDTIQIHRDNVGLNNLVIRDQNNNTATLNVILSHTNFGGMTYNANVNLNDFMLLNNERRTDLIAYGNLRLSGNLNVTGSSAGIFGDGNLRTSSRSTITVNIPQTTTAEDYSGIIFINTPQPQDSLAFLWRQTNTGVRAATAQTPIQMRVGLNINQLLEVGVLLDPVEGTALRNVRGNGDLNLRFDSRATTLVTVQGDYNIQSGNFHYSFQGIRNLDFIIREGSSLTMIGDPMNTRFNITAYHQTRADLITLSSQFQNMPNSRVRVNALLDISGNMENMNLTPDIELPDAPANVQQQVNSLLSSNDTKMLQFAYLTVAGSFAPADGTFFASNNNMATQFGADMLSRMLGTMFASVLSDNWRIGTTLDSQQAGGFDNMRMGVDVSGRFLNDRLRVSTNASYADQNAATNNTAHQSFMVDVDVEYKLNSWLRLRAYNRANDQLYRRNPNTQGIGAVVTREARTLNNLFKFRFGRRNEE